MNKSLSTLASRALNAPSEAEYRGPSREFLVRQACLNVALPHKPDQFWKFYLGHGYEEFVKNFWTDLLRDPESMPARIIAEFNRLQAVHSFKDAGVGK